MGGIILFFFLIGKRCIYVERVYRWASEKWKKISSSLVTVFLSPGGSFQKAFRPYKKKNVSYMIYLLRDLDFLGWEKYQWTSSVFWREERKKFPSECCQIASWTHVAKESSWAISINRKYILTLDPNFFASSSLQCVDERCCSSWLLFCRWVLTRCVHVWNSVV